MKATDPTGKPVRWIPREPPAGPLPVAKLPTLPKPSEDLPDLLPLLNAMRAVLIAAGLAREEEKD